MAASISREQVLRVLATILKPHLHGVTTAEKATILSGAQQLGITQMELYEAANKL